MHRLLEHETDDALLVQIQAALEAKRYTGLRSLLVTFQAAIPTRFTQSLLFETAIYLLLTPSAVVIQAIYHLAFRDYVFPADNEQYERLRDYLFNIYKEHRDLVQEALRLYLLLYFARNGKTVDLQYLLDNCFVQNVLINQHLFEMDTTAKCRLLLQNRFVADKISQNPQLRDRMQHNIYKNNLYLTAALYCPGLVISGLPYLPKAQKYMVYFACLANLRLKDQEIARTVVLQLHEAHDYYTLYIARSVISELGCKREHFLPLWKTPYLYSSGVDAKMQQIRNALKEYTFSTVESLAYFLGVATNVFPGVVWKMLLYYGELNFYTLLDVLKCCKCTKSGLIIDIQPQNLPSFIEYMQYYANSVLHYDFGGIPLELVENVMHYAFQEVKLPRGLKLVDKLIGLSALDYDEIDRFRSYIESLPIETYSSQRFASTNDVEILFAVRIFDYVYNEGKIMYWLAQRGKYADMGVYEVYFAYRPHFSVFDLDRNLLARELGISDSVEQYFDRILAGCDAPPIYSVLQELVKQSSVEIESTDALKQRFKEFYRFALKQYGPDPDIVCLLYYYKIRIDSFHVDVEAQALDTLVIVLLADGSFDANDECLARMLYIAFYFSIPNRCLFERLTKLAYRGFGLLSAKKLYLIGLMYLDMCAAIYNENPLYAKAVLFSQLYGGEKQPCVDGIQIASSAVYYLLDHLGFAILEQEQAQYLLQTDVLSPKDACRVLNYYVANYKSVSCSNWQRINQLAKQYGYDMIFNINAYFPYLETGQRLFDLLGLYSSAITVSDGDEHLMHRLRLLGMRSEICTAQKWRSGLADAAVSENGFDDAMAAIVYTDNSLAFNYIARIRPLSAQIVCYAAYQVIHRLNLGCVHVYSICRIMPAYLAEPLSSSRYIVSNYFVLRLRDVLGRLQSHLLMFQRAYHVREAAGYSYEDHILAQYYLLQYKFDAAALQSLMDEAVQLFDYSGEVSDYISIVSSAILSVILLIVTFEETFIAVIDQLTQKPLTCQLSAGLLYILQTVRDFPQLQYFSKVSKLIKRLLAQRRNSFVVCAYLGITNPFESETRVFLLTVLYFVSYQGEGEYDCAHYQITHPILGERVSRISFKRFASQNAVFKLECWFEDGKSIREVLKISAEDYAALLRAQALFTKINYALWEHSQVFPERTLQTIPVAPIYDFGDDDEELRGYVLKLGCHCMGHMNIVLMPFVAFECVFSAINPFLNADLHANGVYLTNKFLDDIYQFSTEYFIAFQGKLRFDYLEQYFEAKAPGMRYSLLNNFTVTYSASTLICAILGIGDRHLDNICIDYYGNALYIDLEHMFFAGLRYRCQEVVPLRYTRVFARAIPETAFKGIMCKTFAVLKESGLLNEMVDMAPNSIVRLMIKERAECRYRGARNAEDQIQRFIDDSKRVENLRQMYKGWIPWL